MISASAGNESVAVGFAGDEGRGHFTGLAIEGVQECVHDPTGRHNANSNRSKDGQGKNYRSNHCVQVRPTLRMLFVFLRNPKAAELSSLPSRLPHSIRV